MIEFHDVWEWKKGEIPDKICDYIIKNIDSNLYEEGRIQFYKKDTIERNVKIQFDSCNWINALLCGYIRYANHANFHYDLSDWDKESLQISKYSKGEYYKRHQDFRPDTQITRKISLTVQLSDENDYEGGDLIFYNHPDEKERVTSVRGKGSVIVFDSRVFHEVTPVTKGIRYSLVKWYHGDQPLK